MYHIVVAGKMNDENYERVRTCASYLDRSFPTQVRVTYKGMFEAQWEEFLKKTQNELKGSFYAHKLSPLIYLENTREYIGDADDFLKWSLLKFRYLDNTKSFFYKKRAADAIKKIVNDHPKKH